MTQINFDMDGTIANLYGVNGWLDAILNEETTPYREAKPLVNMARLAKALNKAQRKGNKLRVISWTAKGGTTKYNKAVTAVKIEWLNAHLPSVNWDEIKIVAYGTPKSECGNGILFDDEEPNRIEWKGKAYEPNKIFEVLATLQGAGTDFCPGAGGPGSRRRIWGQKNFF